ncbi:MAG: hypothetical protein COA90_09230 [Gammaproteobacteria bacterium]|nr:MAG: hypothetical protein COA90_09230 [Gammaproteobacteria bacterium]
MQDTPSDSASIAALMLKTASQHPWGDDVWTFSGVVPGLPQSAISEIEAQGELFIWTDLALKLHILHCDSYYHNLGSAQPQIYLVCHPDDEAQLKPLLITVDYDEAASYMETGEAVFNAALPVELCKWLEAFVLAHYKPEKMIKRRRKQWHDAESK